jgi:hypothetical protein
MNTKEFKAYYCHTQIMPPVKAYLEGCMYVPFFEGSLSGVGFLCPCGCGLPLWIPNEPYAEGGSLEPRKITRNPDDTITITPSILVNSGCRSHFYITNSKVII